MQTQRCATCGQDWWDSHVCPKQTLKNGQTLADWTAAANKLHAAMPAVRKALDDLDGKTKAREDAATLDAVRQAVLGYYAALDARKHGGVAQDEAFRAVEKALGMHWVQGASISGKTPNAELKGTQRP
jgi:hypothetical protein